MGDTTGLRLIEKLKKDPEKFQKEDGGYKLLEEYFNGLSTETLRDLLCYEDNSEFCHRHIVAAWLELLLQVEVPEKKAHDYDIEVIERPSYIKVYLEDAMRKNRNMRGFNSLRALYLFEKAEKLEREAKKLKDIYGDSAYYIDAHTEQKVRAYEGYMQRACFLRCDADEAEQQYNEQNQNRKKLTKNM